MKKIILLLLLTATATGNLFAQQNQITKGKTEVLGGKTFQHYFAVANGIKIHYVKGGKGTPVVLVHGWPQTWYEWAKQMPALSEKYNVIAVDLRGAGESDKTDSGYNKQTLAKDISELIKVMGLEKVALIGHDIGGMVAYSFAGLFPNQLLGMGIDDVPIPGYEPTWSYVLNDSRAWHFAFHAVPEVPEMIVKGKEKEYLKHFMLSMMANKQAFTDKDFAYYANWMKVPGNLKGGFEYYRAFKKDAEENKPFFTKKITVPVFAFGGQYSMGENQGNMMKGLADSVTSATILNSGHWVTEENAPQFTKELLGFLAKL
jgi:pimeloyl-ACP methyl ester carboxylesterase